MTAKLMFQFILKNALYSIRKNAIRKYSQTPNHKVKKLHSAFFSTHDKYGWMLSQNDAERRRGFERIKEWHETGYLEATEKRKLHSSSQKFDDNIQDIHETNKIYMMKEKNKHIAMAANAPNIIIENHVQPSPVKDVSETQRETPSRGEQLNFMNDTNLKKLTIPPDSQQIKTKRGYTTSPFTTEKADPNKSVKKFAINIPQDSQLTKTDRGYTTSPYTTIKEKDAAIMEEDPYEELPPWISNFHLNEYYKKFNRPTELERADNKCGAKTYKALPQVFTNIRPKPKYRGY